MTEWIDEVWYEDGGMGTAYGAGSGGGAGATAATTTISSIFYGDQTNTATSMTNIPSMYRAWVGGDNEYRSQNIIRQWTSQQQAQLDTTINIQRQAGERAGWVNVSRSADTMYIQWTSLYGAHMAETTERDRARAALARHDTAQRGRIELQAVERAERLLIEHLTPQQRADWARSKFFLVDGKSGRRYRINHGSTANVDLLLPDGRVEARLCAVLYDCPLPDQLLSQKLHIELAEKEFLAVAIRHQPHPERRAA